jgi:hypothetical protein
VGSVEAGLAEEAPLVHLGDQSEAPLNGEEGGHATHDQCCRAEEEESDTPADSDEAERRENERDDHQHTDGNQARERESGEGDDDHVERRGRR